MEYHDFLNQLQQIVDNRKLTKHPFYQLWEMGKLSLDNLRAYAAQYYHLEANFPRYLSAAHANCSDLADRKEILENLNDEEYGKKSHVQLWVQFGEALDLTKEQMEKVQLLDTTCAMINRFTEISKKRGFGEAVASLYAYEFMLPYISETKIAGLKKHYGISRKKDIEFFTVHAVADVEHAASWLRMLEKYAKKDAEQKAILQSTAEACEAMWNMLSGVMQACVAEPKLCERC